MISTVLSAINDVRIRRHQSAACRYHGNDGRIGYGLRLYAGKSFLYAPTMKYSRNMGSAHLP